MLCRIAAVALGCGLLAGPLCARADNEILAMLPRELLDPVASQLRKYLLRSKLVISDESAGTPLFACRR